MQCIKIDKIINCKNDITRIMIIIDKNTKNSGDIDIANDRQYSTWTHRDYHI